MLQKSHEMKMTFAQLAERAKALHSWRVVNALPNWEVIVKLNPAWLEELLEIILARPRKNQSALTAQERNAFNAAVAAALADGSYNTLAAIHSQMSHNMHGFMGFTGAMRFLPWHRVYLHVMEQQLQSYEPDLEIPYWDWANDHTLPSWVMLPSGVTRGPDNQWTLPTQADINNNVLNQSNFVGFEQHLEQYHNTVHMWVGGNTMPYPSVSPHDPMFWLHHANVDRIWAQWQTNHGGVLEPLSGADAVMDPWPDTITGANDTYEYYYYFA